MEDSAIVALYFDRSETAIRETERAYGRYGLTIAKNILGSREDAEECVSDAYMKLWSSIPPERPSRLGLYLGKIVRHLALNRRKALGAAKRGGGQYTVALEELTCDLASREDVEDVMENKRLSSLLEMFLRSLPSEKRVVFLLRYWYFKPVGEIASSLGFSISKVKMTLSRTRNELKVYLEKEGIAL
ncbi:MAG: RNA polymerase sigma factor [Clostridia bacterium]|nr:RNA polymerase sigma factor [Clostridia bacterium]